MRAPRPADIKALPACFTMFTVFMASIGSAQIAPAKQRQRAVCSLKLEGSTAAVEFMVASAQLDCNSTLPISVGVNTTYLGKHILHFTGVQVVSNLACQQQAQGWVTSSGGTFKSMLAMLYFCGDYDITLLQPKVLNMRLEQNSSEWFSAILAFGGSTTATIRQGSFAGNSAGSIIVAFQTATLQVEDSSVFDHNSGLTGTGIKAMDEATVVVRYISFRHNTATWGGALGCYQNASISIDSCLFQNNTVSTWGGAVEIGCVGGQQVTVSNTTFQGNGADSGGAAYIDLNTSVSIESSSFIANHAFTSGGGIYLDTSSAVTATGCTFDRNNASNGGGMYCYGCSLQAGKLSFTNNSAVNYGGALCAANQAQATVSNTTFQGNSADFGAAAFLDTDTTISLDISRFIANRASTSGGCMYLNTSSAITATASTFNMNKASYGGVFYCDGCSIEADRLSFTHNSAVNNGGGIHALDQAQTNISRTTFQDNSADYGGALYIDVNATTSIDDSSFKDNHASTSGGGICLYTDSAITATGCTFDTNDANAGGGLLCDGCSLEAHKLLFINNTAVSNGGGLNLLSQAQATISNITFQDNSADRGEAAFFDENTTISMKSSRFAANHASTSGGGFLASSSVTATGCTFDMNNAVFGGGLTCDGCSLRASRFLFIHSRAVNYGGGLYAMGQAQVVISDSNFTSCSADYGGAVLLLDQASLHMSGCRLWNSTANRDGGAVEAEGQSRILADTSTFIGNNAGGSGAALYMMENQVSSSHNCSFTHNSAGTYGGAIAIETRANLTLSNSTLLNNSADTSGGALFLGDSSIAVVTAGSIVSGNHAGTQGGGGVYARDNSFISINGDTKVQGNVAGFGGGVCATDSAQVIMEGTSVSGNHGTTNGGGLYFDTKARGHLTNCKIALNVAGSMGFMDRVGGGGGVASLRQTSITLQDCLVTNNSAMGEGNGGGILLQDTAKLLLLGGTSVISNHADFGWGGGVSLFSGNFELAQISRAVHSNYGHNDANIQSNVTRLAIVGNASIFNFANRIGTDEGLLRVVLTASGYYGLPCQAVQAQAVLADGTFLGSNVSDQNGLVHLGFKVARPPGVYVILLSSPDARAVPAAKLTLQIRGCIHGEVTPSPVACLPCQQGFFSFDPSQGVCNICPGNANCSGGDVITPLPGYWRSSTDSVQIHRCPNPTACNIAGDSALHACAANHLCGTSPSYKDLQCAPGYHGNVCGLCLPGTGATKLFVCRQCNGSGSIIALYVTAAVVMVCLIKLMCHLNRKQDAAASHRDAEDSQNPEVPAAQLLRPLLLYSQYMLVVSSMPVEWPASMGYPLKVLAWVWSPASPETLSIDCLLPRNARLPISVQQVLFYVCAPLVILGLLLLVEMAQAQYLRIHEKHVAVQVKDMLHSSALVAVFFFYPSILRNLFSMFACIPLDQPAAHPYTPASIGSYWVMDMHQQCFTGYHRAWSLGFGLPSVLLLCLGLPLGILALLSRKRAYSADPTTRQHYGFLYMSYRQPMFCWECVVMAQTMVLVAISVFGVNLGVVYQVIVMNAALVLMVVLLLIFKPYAYHLAGTVMLQAVFCLLLTSYTALTFLQWGVIQPSPEYGIIMGCVVLLVNLGYVVSVLWQMTRLVKWKQGWMFVKRICSNHNHMEP